MSGAATPSTSPISITWIRSLAEPYLRGYQAVAERSGSLRGYWFLTPRRQHRGKGRAAPGRRGREASAGFFVGYLLRAESFAFLTPEPPECLVFAFVRPVGSSVHRRLVNRPESLLRKTTEYIRWLTHRLPRFAFYANELPALVRHYSMRDWPRAKYEHFSRNFFIETLAWLVRSGLIRRLLTESPHHAETFTKGR